MSQGKLPERFRPWKPVSILTAPNATAFEGEVTVADVAAIKALREGTASPDQQKRALRAIVLQIARADDQTFRPDDHGGVRDSDFAAGMRHVGLQVRRLTNEAMSQFETKVVQPAKK